MPAVIRVWKRKKKTPSATGDVKNERTLESTLGNVLGELALDVASRIVVANIVLGGPI